MRSVKISGSELRLIREEKGLTQKGLAALAGIAHNTISEYETGKRQPLAATLDSICVALKVPRQTLIASEDVV